MSYAHYHDLDTQPMVNPATLVDLPAPWARKRRATWADYAFTSEYDRQYTWKFPIPRGKVNEATETEDIVRPPQTPLIYGGVDVATQGATAMPSRLPRPKIEREEATQTVEERAEATQTMEPVIGWGTATEATQTSQAAPTQFVTVATSPLRPQPLTTTVHRVRDEATETEETAVPTVFRKTSDPLFATERPKTAPGPPAQPRPQQILSYGWAHEDPYNEDYDRKTFNVTVSPTEVVPFTQSRFDRAQQYEESRQRKLRRYLQKKAASSPKKIPFVRGLPSDGSPTMGVGLKSEYQRQYMDWSKYLSPPKPRYTTGATHYYSKGVEFARPINHIKRDDIIEHTHADPDSPAWTNLTRRSKPRPASAMDHIKRDDLIERTHYDPERYQWVDQMTADEETQTVGVNVTSTTTRTTGTSTNSSASVGVGSSTKTTTYDLARSLLERAESRKQRA